MQEEVTQKSVTLVFRAAKLDADVLRDAMRMYLNHRRQKIPKGAAAKKHGETTVRKLIGMDSGATSIEIKDGNIKTFKRVARKYNVDFAVKKDGTTMPPKYLVFFKGRDSDVIAQAFKEFVRENEKKKNRVSIREKLKHIRETLFKDQNRERSRENQRNRNAEQSL